jgi:hypothetical protein
MRTVEYQRGYDAGYKQALRDALKDRNPDLPAMSPQRRIQRARRLLYGQAEGEPFHAVIPEHEIR